MDKPRQPCGPLHLVLLALLEKGAQGVQQLHGLAAGAAVLLQERQKTGHHLRVDTARQGGAGAWGAVCVVGAAGGAAAVGGDGEALPPPMVAESC